jgi:hypothetical protein
MTDIKLDPRKLLGFKIIAAGDSTAKLYSPKIGAKGCPVISSDAWQGNNTAVLRAKIGTKTG